MKVLITGAAGGLGRTMANECAKRGYELFLTDISAIQLEKIKSGVTRLYSVKVEVFAANLTDSNSFESLLNHIDRNNLKFDMLLNIAGLDHEGGFADRESSDIMDIVGINVEGTTRITHELLKRRNNPFYIVFVSSLASQFPMPLKATYAASKRYLYDLALSLSEELRDQGVKVLVLCPGGLATTKSTIEAIEAQGFFGIATTNRLEDVCHQSIRRVLKGKTVYFPGIFNNIIRIISKVMPRKIVTMIIYSRWRSSQKKWLPPKKPVETV